MRVDDFDFDLPEKLIALRPAQPRDASRLLHVNPYKDGKITDHQFTDIVDFLTAGDVLVINTTKVFPAALTGTRPARVTSVDQPPMHVDFNLHQKTPSENRNETIWRAFARPAKRVKIGDVMTFGDEFTAEIIARDGAEVSLRFSYTEEEFFTKIHQDGNIPLPPYIGKQRELDEQDKTDYQTIFADEEGSVAAPTAGLHFTEDVFDALKAKGVEIVTVMLHVGAGTFLPVSVDDTDDHQMHAEWGEITPDTAAKINAAKTNGKRIIPVGTTSLRILESSVNEAGQLLPIADSTSIFITPGYQFKIIDGLITNFHLPKSTLFMLVSALAGQDLMRDAYQHAIEHGYRFYSYGDSSLLLKA